MKTRGWVCTPGDYAYPPRPQGLESTCARMEESMLSVREISKDYYLITLFYRCYIFYLVPEHHSSCKLQRTERNDRVRTRI